MSTDIAASAQPTKKGPEGGRAIERAAQVLMELAQHPQGITMTELARRIDTSLPTVHRTLAILRQYELCRETPDGLQAVGVGGVRLAGAFFEGLDLRTEARPVMAEISAQVGETVHLGILSAAHIVYVEKIDSPLVVRMVSRVGGTNPALTTSIGKAILALSPPVKVREVIDASESQLGHLVDEAELRAELDVVRERGYSTDLEGNEAGICCIGVAIRDHTGLPVAGLSVSTPAHRYDPTQEPTIGTYLAGRAEVLSHRMGYLPAEQPL